MRVRWGGTVLQSHGCPVLPVGWLTVDCSGHRMLVNGWCVRHGVLALHVLLRMYVSVFPTPHMLRGYALMP